MRVLVDMRVCVCIVCFVFACFLCVMCVMFTCLFRLCARVGCVVDSHMPFILFGLCYVAFVCVACLMCLFCALCLLLACFVWFT